MQRAALLFAGASALQAPALKRPARTVHQSEPAGGWDTSRYGEAGTALTMADESPFVSAPQAEVQSVGEGLHGEASCFLPLDQLDNGVLWPRIIRVAGIYPGLTQAEVTAVPMAPEPPDQDGLWLFDFPDAHGAEYGVVAMPGSDLICGALDPVAIVASSGSLGLMIDEKECLVIIDRGEIDFSDRSFFCYADANGNCSIRRMDDAYEGWTILGKVACVTLPWDADSMAKKGTWMEEDD